MIRRLLPFLLAAMVLAVGLGSAQQPADPGDPPLRLKKKKRTDAPAAKLPDKDDKEQVKPKLPPPPGGKEKAKEDDPLEPEDGRAEPEEDEKEVLERIGRNMRSVEEKLGNRELGDPTSQQQRDIVRDLEKLIRKQQQNQGGGGSDDQPQQNQGGEQDKDQGKQGERGQQSRNKQGNQSGMSRGKQRQQRRQRSGRQRGQSGQQKSGSGGEQSQQQPGSTGNSPGGGGKSPQNDKNINADLYKEVWGHLPESMRAEMNAYSNPSPFLPRYDDLIKKYYRTIAEQGRKKGD